MLYKVEVRTPTGDLLTLQLDDISDGFIVEEIAGLDPVKATLVSSSFAQQDGAQYQASRRETRNVTMKIQMDPQDDTTVEDLRNRLYGYFMPKSEVSLRFYSTNGLTVDIDGRVESFEAPLFTADPEANVSIINFDPDFRDPTPVVITGLTTADSAGTDIEYDGTVETGMEFSIAIADNKSEITIYQTTPSGDLYSLDFSVPLVVGDTLKISTVAGSKGATLTHLGTDSSVLYGVSPQSSWVQIQPGINTFRVYAEGDSSPVTITYTSRYGGL